MLVIRLFPHPCECFVPAQAKRWAEWPPRHAHGISPPVEKARPFGFAQDRLWGTRGSFVHLEKWMAGPPTFSLRSWD